MLRPETIPTAHEEILRRAMGIWLDAEVERGAELRRLSRLGRVTCRRDLRGVAGSLCRLGSVAHARTRATRGRLIEILRNTPPRSP